MRKWNTVTLMIVVAMMVALPPAANVSRPNPAHSFMPPHPDLLERVRRGEIELPDVIIDPAVRLAQGLDQPQQRLVGPAGTWQALALLVQFTDNAASTGATYFDTLLFSTGTGTLKDYYDEVSYGILDIVTVNLPSTIGWMTMPQTYNYYVNGNYGLGSYPQNAQRLAEDAVLTADPVVDYSQYDNDGDGWVDTVFIVHAGPGAEFTGSVNDIWSHSWSTASDPFVDGVTVNNYTMEPEYWISPGDMTMGVYAHELGHAFGLPDLYDVDYSSAGVGDWSLMAGGSWNGFNGNSPAWLDAWCRAQLGWVTPTNVTANTPGATIPSAETSQTVYRLWTDGTVGSEYFLVENRQLTGYDAALPGDGVMIWHVDEDKSGNTDECDQLNNWNCGTNHFLVALEQADGNWDLEDYANQGDGGDPYPGASSNHNFDFGTIPNSSSYWHSADTCVGVNAISNSGATMTADLNVSCVTATPDIAVAPSSLATTLVPDQLDYRTFDILNFGDGDLEWAIYEAPSPVQARDLPETAPGDPAAATEDVGTAATEAPEAQAAESAPPLPMPSAILYDNGPLVNSPGTGAGGADESTVQTGLGMGTYGFGHQLSAGNRIADEFTVTDPSGWAIDYIHFFAYQTNSTTASTMTAVNYQIWDGPPDDPASSVVFGDTATNRLISTGWSGIYRVLDTSSGDTTRPVMINSVSAGLVLPPGTYWLDWQADGDPALSGPWAPPITINGQTTTGNALQYAGGWVPLADTGTATSQGLPFVIEGTVVSVCPASDIPWASVSPTGGTTPPEGSSLVSVLFNSTGLGPGLYSAELCIESNDPDENPFWLPVSLEVTEPPDIVLSPSAFGFTVPEGAADGGTLTVENIGSGNLDWTLSAATFAADVVGDWTVYYDWGCTGSPGTAGMTFYDDFTFVDSTGQPGKWLLNGNHIVWIWDHIPTDYAGTVIGDTMEGTMMSPYAMSGCWTADRVVADAAPPAAGTRLPSGLLAGQMAPVAGHSNLAYQRLLAAGGLPLRHYQLAEPAPPSGASPDRDASPSEPPTADVGPRPTVLLADLSGVNILYDTGHGQRDSVLVTILIADLEARGATVAVRDDPITGDLLAAYDILWVDEWGLQTWSSREQDVVLRWVELGNGLLLHGDELYSGDVLAPLFDIEYTGVGGYAGVTTDIQPHPITAGVGQVQVSAPYNSLSVYGSAACIVNDVGGLPHLCVNSIGRGRVVAVADDDFVDSVIGANDNQLLANQTFDWLAAAGESWLTAIPSAGTTAPAGSSPVDVIADSAGLPPGTYEGAIFAFSNDPDESPVGIPVTLEVTAPLGLLNGTINLQGRMDHSGAEVCAWDGPTIVDCATTAPDGYYEIPLAPGIYDVTANMARYLDSERLGETVGTGTHTLPGVTLLGGDANDDCTVNILDLAFMGARFGLNVGDPGWDDRADINADGTINIQDIVLAGVNFESTCPVPW